MEVPIELPKFWADCRNYFAKGDTQVFQTIQFDLKTPTKAERSILEFIQHVNRQKALTWKTWESVDNLENSDR